MLPPFRIRNLHLASLPKGCRESQDNLIRINAPHYDDIIYTHPAATLKYYDEDDGDIITVGSLLPQTLYLVYAQSHHTAWVL